MLDIWVAGVARAGGIEVPLTPTVAAPRAPGLVQRACKAVAALAAAEDLTPRRLLDLLDRLRNEARDEFLQVRQNREIDLGALWGRVMEANRRWFRGEDVTHPCLFQSHSSHVLGHIHPGIFGLVAGNLAEGGLGVLGGYARILMILLGCMVTVALVITADGTKVPVGTPGAGSSSGAT